MKFKIPFTFSSTEVLKRRSKNYLKFTSNKKGKITEYLQGTGEDINRAQYLSICYRNFFLDFLVFIVISTSVIGYYSVQLFYLYGFLIALLFSGFVLMIQINYPRIYASKKARNIEKNLISALQDMLVQLNSGVPIYRIIVNLSDSGYGEVSEEFVKIVKEINSGTPQIDAIEKSAKLNTSEYFRRVLWQLGNGMRAGSDMSVVIKNGIKNLNDEQEIQIQSYGSKLNPLVMFYMLIAVIIPSLGITFLVILSSFLSFPEKRVKFVFVIIFFFVVFAQIMFLGLIKSRRPSLL